MFPSLTHFKGWGESQESNSGNWDLSRLIAKCYSFPKSWLALLLGPRENATTGQVFLLQEEVTAATANELCRSQWAVGQSERDMTRNTAGEHSRQQPGCIGHKTFSSKRVFLFHVLSLFTNIPSIVQEVNPLFQRDNLKHPYFSSSWCCDMKKGAANLYPKHTIITTINLHWKWQILPWAQRTLTAPA